MLKLKIRCVPGILVIGLLLLFGQTVQAQSVTDSEVSRQNTKKATAKLNQSGEYDSLMQAVKNARQKTVADRKTNNFANEGGAQNVIGETAKLFGSESTAGAQFGVSVAISGNTAIVGAYSDDVGATNQGSAYIFVKSGTSWIQQARLIASDGALDDAFGFSVAISGDTAVVGANLDDVGANENQGSAYVFTRTGTTWTQQAKLTAPDGMKNDQFGRSVAIEGETVIVGAPGYDFFVGKISPGSAYVFVKSGTAWLNQAILLASDAVGQDYFGAGVAISGDTAIVGAEFDNVNSNSNQGSAYVFVRSGADWTEQAKLIAADGAPNDRLGSRVAVSGDTVLIGAAEDDIEANSNQGSAYIFTRTGTTWNQQAKLIASDGAPGDFFGAGVALGDNTAIVGGYGIDIAANGHQGAIYVFTRSGATWTQQTKLIASDGALGDNFGASVAIDGSNIIAGAHLKAFGGAAYMFQILSADISGRVLTSGGRGLSGAIVSIADQQGNIRTAMTNPFGFYRFIEIEAGATYTVSVRSKRFQFAPQTVTVNNDIADLDFIPNP